MGCFGPVVRTSTGVLRAAPLLGSSYAIATAALVRRHRHRHLPRMPVPVEEPVSSAAFFDGDFSQPSNPEDDFDSVFGAQMRWRVRGLGIVSVHSLTRMPSPQ